MTEGFKSTFSLALGSVLLLMTTGALGQTPAAQLQLNSDRTNIKAGERVRISIVPPKLARDYSFAIGFQDGPIEVLPAGQTEIDHDYLLPGTYTVSVTPRPLDEAAPRPPDFSNSKVIIHVDGAPLIAAPESLNVGEPVTFTIDVTPPTGVKTKFRFNFGDGTSTAWREDRQISYTYTQSEVYTARGDILREGWAQPVVTLPVEVAVRAAARTSPFAKKSTRDVAFVGSLPFWALIAAGLATTVFAGIKIRQRRLRPVPSYELHRSGSGGNIQSLVAPEVLMEVVLIPGIDTGRHYAGKIEATRAPGTRRTHG